MILELTDIAGTSYCSIHFDAQSRDLTAQTSKDSDLVTRTRVLHLDHGESGNETSVSLILTLESSNVCDVLGQVLCTQRLTRSQLQLPPGGNVAYDDVLSRMIMYD